jgi:hypothetical protein
MIFERASASQCCSYAQGGGGRVIHKRNYNNAEHIYINMCLAHKTSGS